MIVSNTSNIRRPNIKLFRSIFFQCHVFPGILLLACFSLVYNMLSVGNIYVHSVYEYELIEVRIIASGLKSKLWRSFCHALPGFKCLFGIFKSLWIALYQLVSAGSSERVFNTFKQKGEQSASEAFLSA